MKLLWQSCAPVDVNVNDWLVWYIEGDPGGIITIWQLGHHLFSTCVTERVGGVRQQEWVCWQATHTLPGGLGTYCTCQFG